MLRFIWRQVWGSMTRLCCMVWFGWLVGAGLSAGAEDWPTCRHDNQRSGVTAESLSLPLQPVWTFESCFPPAAGWPLPVNGYGARKNRPNVSFDDAPRVIAVGDRCYFNSSAENRIYALDAATGAVIWAHDTDAAPRLAPAWWQDRLLVGADDGRFRCLDADSGALRWQIQAAPREDLVLGQGRFCSLWPIRAAGIVDDDTVYFTAGLFPAQQIYFYAVSATINGDGHSTANYCSAGSTPARPCCTTDTSTSRWMTTCWQWTNTACPI